MTPLVSAIIVKALDGLSLRSQATAQNIANVNSPAYRPLRVSFESQLAAASERGEEAVRAVSPTMAEDPLSTGAVRMDLELAEQSATALRYGALVDVLGRELSIEHLILRGGQ